MREASGGALAPWILPKWLNLIAGAWHVQMCVQRVGQPSKDAAQISGQPLGQRQAPASRSISAGSPVQEVSEDTNGTWAQMGPDGPRLPQGPTQLPAHPLRDVRIPCALILSSDSTSTFYSARVSEQGTGQGWGAAWTHTEAALLRASG